MVNDQYRDSTNLRARARIYELFGQGGVNWYRWVFDQLALPETARVLELGCGPGTFWLKNRHRIPVGWHVTLTDLSAGMIDEARSNLCELGPNYDFEVVDAQELAYESDSFDAVIAGHMLYHVDDREKAFSAIHSVLNAGGALYAATNGADHLRQLRALGRSAKPAASWSPLALPFTLENGGAQLDTWFEHVEIRRFGRELRVTEVQPLIDYVQSTERTRLDEEEQRRLGALIEKQISVNGFYRITTVTGLFVATKGAAKRAGSLL